MQAVLAFSLLIAPPASHPALSGPEWTAESNQRGAWLGASVACAGDVNGDGWSDVIVGAPYFDNGELDEGRALLFLGGASGLSPTPAWTAESDRLNAEFGNSVATAGDVNGDGFSDVIVGARHYANGESNEGRVFVYLGSSSGLSTTPAWTAESDQADAAFGFSVATAGDVDGDGFSDVIVGAWQFDHGETNEGRAYVYLGSSTGLAASAAWTAESDQADARYGISVSPAGDVDGDGFDDVIVGADQFDNGEIDEGRAFLYRGSSSGLSATPAWTAEADQAVAHLGMSVATAGDVNGDGFSDVAIGAPNFTNIQVNEGRALVYLGSSTGLATSASWTVECDRDFSTFASSIATAGDVNGDSYSDVIIGAQGFDDGEINEGGAFVYLGSASGLESTASWSAEGDQFAARYGFSVATAGDTNGDGYSDVIVGANLYDNGQPSEGRAFLYRGRGATLLTRAQWSSSPSFGTVSAVASAGDVDGDGYGDVIYGNEQFAGTSQGRAGVSHGSDAGPTTERDWFHVGGGGYAADVASAGDVNGDGFGDVIVGARLASNGQSSEGRASVYHGSNRGLLLAAAWSAESNEVGANFGDAVASAGDVNGDGYGDVIVGAPNAGRPSRGRAWVYYGSSTGLSAVADWTVFGPADGARFGANVGCAGDVNADGYSDVVVGAFGFANGEAGEGAAYLYLGSHGGLATSPAWSAEGGQAFAGFGRPVATAGDVNGDGYSDVIVGAPSFSFDQVVEGGAFVYLGSSAGLLSSASWTFESNDSSAGGLGGISAASAGDVNGDGYSDVAFGAATFGVPAIGGRAWLYLGSSTGLLAEPEWIVDGSDPFAFVGTAVAAAGDVNGDGFGDVILTHTGRALVYFGNAGRGSWNLAPQQRQTQRVTPIQPLGRSTDRDEFRIHLAFPHEVAGFSWASGGAPRAKLEWEVKPLGSPLDGSTLDSGAYDVIDGSLLRFNEIVSFTSSAPPSPGIGGHSPLLSRSYAWRARIRTNNPLLPVTPWVSIAGNNVTEAKLRAGPARSRR